MAERVDQFDLSRMPQSPKLFSKSGKIRAVVDFDYEVIRGQQPGLRASNDIHLRTFHN
jgi:hypothetical protein